MAWLERVNVVFCVKLEIFALINNFHYEKQTTSMVRSINFVENLD
jgi:hypothetical protein